ncbi:MAG: HEAT repeat domain-containing protein [Candidatus Riflebacteria bacterium]|nr:HEAT repeat domain-containing protein [Candidatus Riflebacteria bacterium]
MPSAQIEELLRQLKDSNENTRLKAANFLTKNKPPEGAACIPALKELFWHDANPAVQFLAKKALVNLGANIDSVQNEGASNLAARVAAPEDTPDTSPTPKDHEVLWKVASDEFRPLVTMLFQLLDSSDAHVLEQVSDAAEKLGTVLCAAPLLEALEREQTRSRGTESRGGLATYDDVKELIHIAKLKHSGINPATAAAMGNLTCPEVLEAFIDMLRSDNEVLRNNAVRILAELKDPHTVEPLLRLLGGDNARLEAKVIKTVSKIVRENKESQDHVVRSIIAHFRPTESEFKLYSIVEALGRIAYLPSLPFLTECLRHALPRVRANAVEAISRLGIPDDELIRLLGPMLNDENNRVLANTVAALWHTAAQERARRSMESALNHADKWYRASIAFALGQIDVADSATHLVTLMRDQDADVRRNAENAIHRLKDKGAIAKLVEYINDENLDVRIKAIEVIGSSGITAYNDVLHLMMIDAESFPRLLATVVLALGRMQLPENIATISYYLNDRDERIRANAVEALEAINDPKVMSLINLAVSDNHPRVRGNAAKALWRFGELGTMQVVHKMMEAPMLDHQSSGAFSFGEMAITVREKARLSACPMLAAALRRLPRYRQLAQG